MHTDFDGFPWTKEHIGEKFCGGGGGEVECCTVFMGSFFPDDICVFFLEKFVESVLSGSCRKLVYVQGYKYNDRKEQRGSGL